MLVQYGAAIKRVLSELPIVYKSTTFELMQALRRITEEQYDDAMQ